MIYKKKTSATLALLKHSPEPSVHEAARNVQIIGTQCVITVPVGVHHHPVHVVYELYQLVYTIILYM